MVTSFAPSPIESVNGSGFTPFLTKLTISAFWLGDTRHATTALHIFANSSSLGLIFLSSALQSSSSLIFVKVGPSMMSERCSKVLPRCSERAASCWLMILSAAAGSSSLIIIFSILLLRRLHAYPMLMAVSCLSPVSTQIFKPPLARLAIASGTPAWSLSSMAVAPTSSISFSISSAMSISFSSLSVRDVEASSNLAFQSANSDGDNTRLASTSVRRPSEPKVSNCPVSLSVVRFSMVGSRRSKIILSAPLQ
mmetsp:Transcript_49780/g.128075  ORF Transcript_49780/g.128075 Transcript_49780/m.128075 type:complete len:252 (-) Transcript_49780:654-1409(-)